MYGIGAVVHIINILPFAYFLFTPFAFRRYNLLGVNPIGNHRFYYRKWWARMFFGRFQYTAYGIGVPLYLLYKYLQKDITERSLTSFTAFYSDYENFDEELSSNHKLALSNYIFRKKTDENKNLIKAKRAQLDHDLKIQAFEKYERDNLDDLI